MQKIFGIFIFTLGTLALADACLAASPYLHIKQKMNYQGLLADNTGTPYTGNRNLVFRIFDQSSGGTALWSETQSGVPVTAGIFNVVLGSVTPITISFRKEYWLEIQVETETLAPRHLLTSTSYAMASRKVVYQQVITVALDGGDTNTVYAALQMISAENPTPGAADQWLIDVQAGTFTEPGSWTIPAGISIRGQGQGTTTLNLPLNATITMNSNSGLEALTLSLQGSSSNLSMASASDSYIRNCRLITSQSNPFVVNMQATDACVFENNQVLAQTSGNYVLYMQTAVGARVLNNYFDLTQINSAGTGIYAANITRCMIAQNLINFEGATDGSYGIKINNGDNSSRVSHNIFYGEITTPHASDIYSTANLGYPVRPTHAGPYGIGNQGSDGSELPNF